MTKKETIETLKEKAAPKAKKGAIEATEAQKAAKAAADKALADTAMNMPHGSGKRFLELTKELDGIESRIGAENTKKRGVRAALKEMKVELRPYDQVRKLRKMEPEDMKSFEASVALYKDQLGMSLSVHQEVIKKELEGQREAAREAMLDASGGDTGKEIGSVTAPDAAPVAEDKPSAVVPLKNESFRPVGTAAH